MQKCLHGSKIVLFGMQKQITQGEHGSDSSASSDSAFFTEWLCGSTLYTSLTSKLTSEL
jgi:hypothetical protein